MAVKLVKKRSEGMDYYYNRCVSNNHIISLITSDVMIQRIDFSEAIVV